MKNLLFLSICILSFSLNTFSQTTEKKLNFCKQYFRAEGLVQLALKYKDENSMIFADEANKAAIRAENALKEIEPTIKTKLNKQELDDLKASIRLIKEKTAEEFDEGSRMKMTLFLQLSEQRLSKIFSKLMK